MVILQRFVCNVSIIHVPCVDKYKCDIGLLLNFVQKLFQVRKKTTKYNILECTFIFFELFLCLYT